MPPFPGSGMEVMIFGGVGTAHNPKNHYLLRTAPSLSCCCVMFEQEMLA